MIKDVTKYSPTEIEILSCADYDEYTPGYVINQMEEWWSDHREYVVAALNSILPGTQVMLVWDISSGNNFTARLMFEETIYSPALIEQIIEELDEYITRFPIV